MATASLNDKSQTLAIVSGVHTDPFSYLGMHEGKDGYLVIRVFQPHAKAIRVLANGRTVAKLDCWHEAGFFGKLINRKNAFHYQLKIEQQSRIEVVDDPYQYEPQISDFDLQLIAGGIHKHIYNILGAQRHAVNGVTGTRFALWAPNAKVVSVLGDFNRWDDRAHPMRLLHQAGVWEIFIPSAKPGMRYKFALRNARNNLLPYKADPYARSMELRPATASVIPDEADYRWRDKRYLGERENHMQRDKPISIYEVHLGSWKRGRGDRFLTYRELARDLVQYVKSMGFTHLQLMPVSEHPFDGSWGYQPVGLFAPTSRFGTPEDFKYFVDRCHQADIGVLIDWVPGHFPSDPHGLAHFDGTHLYEHEDPKQGYHPDWNTLIYNYGRSEVCNFLRASGHFWLDEYHVDGIRVDAVASMLYLDYSREAGEWIPNKHGGNENLEAIEFLKGFNEELYGEFPGTFSVAEESTAWPGVSKPTYDGGLGFGYKWNMGWMNDTLSYMKEDPVHRKYHHDKISFGLVYAFDENFILPLSHDEVVHGKGSLLDRMPGDPWQKFANLRAYFGFMWTHPGKKLLFMGGEFAHGSEWNHDSQLDWGLLDIDWHDGMQKLVRDLNQLYRDVPALYELDCEREGFEWLDYQNAEQSVFSYVRYDKARKSPVIIIVNFTPVTHKNFQLGVPEKGLYREIFNTDAILYCGSGQTNAKTMKTVKKPMHGQAQSIKLTLPPLATIVISK